MAHRPRTEQQITGNHNVQASGGSTVIVNPPPRTPAQRNRRVMLDKVQHIWIDGVLQHSLYQEVLIALGLSEHPAAVTRPLDLQVQNADQVEEALAPGTRLLDLYDRFGQALLILGAPGAGKTTLLLELTHALIQRAREDESHPIPVVFPLASWAASRRPVQDWLVEELGKRYEVPRKIAQPWVDSDMILPLLDGVDEVTVEHRAACVDAINAFRRDHGLLPLVVTSRRVAYDALSSRLRLPSAIVVQPLTREQVRHYLREAGLRVAPSSQSPLWDLLDTPLMLNIATLTYAGHSGTVLPSSATADEQRDHLFAAYVDRMLHRKRSSTRHPAQRAKQWLTWLAWQLQQHSLPILYLVQLGSNHDRVTV